MAGVAGADAYFQPTLRWEQWGAHSEDRRERAVHEAGAEISRLTFRPRPPAAALDGAIYEQAFCLLETPAETAQRTQAILSGLKSVSAGRQSESYQDADKLTGFVDGVLLCPAALAWLRPYLQTGGAVRGGRLASGRRLC